MAAQRRQHHRRHGQDYTHRRGRAGDNGARFRAIVSNAIGSVLSNEATLTVTANQPPAGTITQPAAGTLYSGGSVINYAGTATDPEDGTLPASAFTWRVDFHHDTHSHPFIPPTTGVDQRLVHDPDDRRDRRPTSGIASYLTVRDSGGLTHTTLRDVLPRKANLTLATNPAGLQLRLDGQPTPTPLDLRERRRDRARASRRRRTQPSGGTTYEFVSWSDGGAATHNISTPAPRTPPTPRPIASPPAARGTGLSATYFDNADFTGTSVTRIDPTVDFDWGSGRRPPAIARRHVQRALDRPGRAAVHQTYTFYTQSDDGVRLWVNGQQIVNNWTDHAPIENSGTIALTAGQRYDIRMEFYENGGGATARLLVEQRRRRRRRSCRRRACYLRGTTPGVRSASTSSRPAAPVPAGYLPTPGSSFGNRGNGQSYGWTVDNTRADARSQRGELARSALRHADAPAEAGQPRRRLGDCRAERQLLRADRRRATRTNFDSVFRTTAEGVLVVSGTPTTSARWIEGTATVTVTDGRLTLRSGAGASNNKICFVEVVGQ